MKHASVRYLPVSLDSPDQTPREYTISLGESLIANLSSYVSLASYSSVVIVTDDTVAPLWAATLIQGIGREVPCITLPSGEESKNISSLGKLWEEFARHRLDRKSLVINLGGGVITDIGGFAASTYMRGISFIQIPTTLLAQVDASIGGKTGIDHATIKNLVGSFTQPQAVIIDIDTLSTLPSRELASGFAEIIKHGLILDSTYLKKIQAYSAHSATAALGDLIEGSCKLKRDIVIEDPKERGVRKLLNFGHTLGHAIESLLLSTPQRILHGEAVSIGMVGEAFLSMKLGKISEPFLHEIEKLLTAFSLPIRLPTPLSASAITSQIALDKKNSHNKILWTLLNGNDRGVYNQEVPEQRVQEAIEYLLN